MAKFCASDTLKAHNNWEIISSVGLLLEVTKLDEQVCQPSKQMAIIWVKDIITYDNSIFIVLPYFSK